EQPIWRSGSPVKIIAIAIARITPSETAFSPPANRNKAAKRNHVGVHENCGRHMEPVFLRRDWLRGEKGPYHAEQDLMQSAHGKQPSAMAGPRSFDTGAAS